VNVLTISFVMFFLSNAYIVYIVDCIVDELVYIAEIVFDLSVC
jgi:hypothetical protein